MIVFFLSKYIVKHYFFFFIFRPLSRPRRARIAKKINASVKTNGGGVRRKKETGMKPRTGRADIKNTFFKKIVFLLKRRNPFQSSTVLPYEISEAD